MSSGSIYVFLILFLLISTGAAAQRKASNITLGSSLTLNASSSWRSPSGLFSFGFFPQHLNATAVGIFLPDKTVVWTANRDDPAIPNDVFALQLTTDGRLILRRSHGQELDLITPLTPMIASASMLDNGNFVLYGVDSQVIWQSFENPTNTLLPGQRLLPGEELFSSASETDHSRGIFRLKMQNDGNLVQYPVNTPDTAAFGYFSTETYSVGPGARNISLNLDSDGTLFLLLDGNTSLRNITKGGFPTQDTTYLMRLDVGGIFRLYSLSLNPFGNWTRIWSSTEDTCYPKGFCGVNSFCINMDVLAECLCLPGFVLVQSGNYTAGCSRSVLAQGCPKIDDQQFRSEIRVVENTVWLENSYEVLNIATQEECSHACLDDCNCEAAIFQVDSGQCRKQKLPLTYGRRSLSNSDRALIRITNTTTLRQTMQKRFLIMSSSRKRGV